MEVMGRARAVGRRLPLRLQPRRLGSVRFATGGFRGSNQGANAKPQRPNIQRFRPDNSTTFFSSDGILTTTPENRDFLLKHGLEPDNGSMRSLTFDPDCKTLRKEHSIEAAYSPRHIIHPYHLGYFDPRGHPLAAQNRANYERALREKPLWIIGTSAGTSKAFVRLTASRRVKAAIYLALEELGYNREAWQSAKLISGTVRVTIFDPVKAVNLRKEWVGMAIAKAVVKAAATVSSNSRGSQGQSGKGQRPERHSMNHQHREVKRRPPS